MKHFDYLADCKEACKSINMKLTLLCSCSLELNVLKKKLFSEVKSQLLNILL